MHCIEEDSTQLAPPSDHIYPTVEETARQLGFPEWCAVRIGQAIAQDPIWVSRDLDDPANAAADAALVVHFCGPVRAHLRCLTCFLLTMLPLEPESSRILTGFWLSVGCCPGLVNTSPNMTDDSSLFSFFFGFLTLDST